MNQADENKANWIIAKDMGLMSVEIVGDEVEYQKPANQMSPTENRRGYRTLAYVFNIFDSDTDLKNAVIRLGDVHRVFIRPSDKGEKLWYATSLYVEMRTEASTYQEAVADAYIFLNGMRKMSSGMHEAMNDYCGRS